LHYYYMLYCYETNCISLSCWIKWKEKGNIAFHCPLLSVYIPLITIDVKTTFCHSTYTCWQVDFILTHASLCVSQVFHLTTCQAKYPFVKWERKITMLWHTLFFLLCPYKSWKEESIYFPLRHLTKDMWKNRQLTVTQERCHIRERCILSFFWSMERECRRHKKLYS